MTDLIAHGGNAVTMTSLELVDFINDHRRLQAAMLLAEFPSKGFAKLGHADLLKKVQEVLGEHAGNFSCMFDVAIGNGAVRKSPGYTFPKREACLMAMSYSYNLQAKVFDKMTALEEQLAKPAIPQTLPEALRLAAEALEQKAAAEKQRDAAAAQVAELAPKALALDRFAGHDGQHNVRNAAKLLGVREKAFITWLIAHDWMYRDHSGRLCAKAQKLVDGYLDTVPVDIHHREYTETRPQPVITQKGLARLAVLLVRAGLIQKQEEAGLFCGLGVDGLVKKIEAVA